MELRDYFLVIRARKWVIIQAVIVLTAASLIFSLAQAPTYSGEALVLVSEKGSSASVFGGVLPEFSSQPERGLETQVQLMQMRPIAETVVRELGLQMSPGSLLGRVEVAAVGQTNIVRITVTDSDPETAAEIANAMASAFVDFSRDVRRESLRAAVEEVEARLATAQDQILELGREIEESGRSDEVSAELQIATGLYTSLADQLVQLQIDEQLEEGSGRVVSPAAVNEAVVSPRPVRNTLLGVVVGLVFGLGTAFVYEYLDDTVKSSEELSGLYGVPALGVIPYHEAKSQGGRHLVVRESSAGPAGEAYRMLRNALEFINFEHDIQTLLVTSASPEEGKSTIAANMAATLAQANVRVVFVCSDFRRPTSHEFFGVENEVGLSDVLLGETTLADALVQPYGDNLLVLTSGRMPPNPAELLASERMRAVMDGLKEFADWVIVDSPPLLAVADAAAVARWVDGVVLVSRATRSTRSAARRAAEQLSAVGARVIGVLTSASLDETEARRVYLGYGGYYGSRGYYLPDMGAGVDDGTDDDARSSGPGLDRRGSRAPEESTPAQKFFAAAVAFIVVLFGAGLAVYLLDQLFEWEIVETLLDLL